MTKRAADAQSDVRASCHSIEWLAEQIADPELPIGGGAMSGVTLAGASAAAELVIGLAARRKANVPHRAEIEDILSRLRTLRPRFLEGTDRDLVALNELLAAQHALKRASSSAEQEDLRAHLRDATLQAARVPIELCLDALSLLRLADQALPFASRFTVSDLGVASALASGAITAAVLTSEINLALLGDAPEAQDLKKRVDDIRREAGFLNAQILRRTRAWITGESPEEDRHDQMA
jgi:formiminotetrahydrofolate cyclodeaminase